jgi:hypothetical protein
MHYRLPFMVEDLPHNKWFNWGPPPPGTETGGPAVVYNRFGKGQSLYLGAPIFQEMSEKLFWTQNWIPLVMRDLVKNPIAELAFPTLPKHLHGTFFWDRSKHFILVQILNSIELSTGAEFVDIPHADVSWNPARLNVTAARMMWPKKQDYSVRVTEARATLRVPSPGRYAAIYLKIS